MAEQVRELHAEQMSKMPLKRIRAKAKLTVIVIEVLVRKRMRRIIDPRCTLTTLPYFYYVFNVFMFNALYIYALRTTLHNLSWGVRLDTPRIS